MVARRPAHPRFLWREQRSDPHPLPVGHLPGERLCQTSRESTHADRVLMSAPFCVTTLGDRLMAAPPVRPRKTGGEALWGLRETHH